MEVSPRDIMYRLPADEVLVDAGAVPHHLAQTDLRCPSPLLMCFCSPSSAQYLHACSHVAPIMLTLAVGRGSVLLWLLSPLT